jgi:hypothetical protein
VNWNMNSYSLLLLLFAGAGVMDESNRLLLAVLSANDP